MEGFEYEAPNIELFTYPKPQNLFAFHAKRYNERINEEL